ncbi:MAG: histone deacetylase family protein, partial [Microcoleus sp. SIO2G3]|nr:histone deacetylase family protein [Microcoleus sp. SIO2G3]
MLTIYSSDHVYQNAAVELIDGKLLSPFEHPRRAEMVLTQVHTANLGKVIAPQEFGLAPILRVHDRHFVEFLQTAWDEWQQTHGDYDALPLNWAVRTMRHDRIPETIDGNLSYYAFDAGTP